MDNDTNTSDSGAAFESDVDDIYGTEDESSDDEDPAQPTKEA